MNFYPFFYLPSPCTIYETNLHHPSSINVSLSHPCCLCRSIASRIFFFFFFKVLESFTRGRGKGIKTGIWDSNNKTGWQLEKNSHMNETRFMATEREYDSTDTNNLRNVYRYACFSYIAIHSASTAKGIPWLSTYTVQSCFSHTTKYIYI